MDGRPSQPLHYPHDELHADRVTRRANACQLTGCAPEHPRQLRSSHMKFLPAPIEGSVQAGQVPPWSSVGVKPMQTSANGFPPAGEEALGGPSDTLEKHQCVLAGRVPSPGHRNDGGRTERAVVGTGPAELGVHFPHLLGDPRPAQASHRSWSIQRQVQRSEEVYDLGLPSPSHAFQNRTRRSL